MFKKLAPIEALSVNKPSSQNRLLLTNQKESPLLDNDSRSSRMNSLTSVWTDNTYPDKSEKVGIRRLARACTKSFLLWNSEALNSDGERSDLGCRYSRNGYLSEHSKTFLDSDYRKLAHTEKIHEHDLELHRLRRLHFNGYESKAKTLGIQQRKALGNSKPSLENIARDGKTLIKGSRKSLDSLHTRRIIVIRNLLTACGVKSTLSQVCGGPLERIVFHEHKKGSEIELYFLFPEHARKFYEFGSNTGLLVLNGTHLTVEWANKTNVQGLEHIHPTIPNYLKHEVDYFGARRCLIFSKSVPEKSNRHSQVMHYPSPRTHLSKDLNIEEIEKDFAAFGEIVEIASVISRKLCFCLHFADIRSAIIIKKECETEGSTLNAKYNAWSIWYGKDPTDKPCLTI